MSAVNLYLAAIADLQLIATTCSTPTPPRDELVYCYLCGYMTSAHRLSSPLARISARRLARHWACWLA